MTKKDYELIARVIKDVRGEFLAPERIDYLSKKLANALMETNERFDYNRFLTACGIQD